MATDPVKYPHLAAYNERATHEMRVEAGRKGGIKSGETRSRQKTFRESVKALMRCKPFDEEQCRELEEMGLDVTMLNQIQKAVFEKAARGDVEAARYLRDTAGEKPRDGVDLDVTEKPIAALDMSKLSDEQLQLLAARAAEAGNTEDE